MSGTPIGALHAKLGLKSPVKPGERIRAMNLKMKSHSSAALSGLKKFVEEEEKEKKGKMKRKLGSQVEPKEHLEHFKCKMCGAMYKSASALKSHLNDHDADDRKYKIKTTGKSYGKSNRLGGGGRFQQVKHAVAGKKGVYNPVS